MKWLVLALAGVAAVNAVVLVSVARERAAPATYATIDVCRQELVGVGRSDEPPALLIRLAAESLPAAPGLDAAGLRDLGFPEAVIAAIGRPRDSTFRWPRPRPAWVLLRQRHDSLMRFAVAAVAPRRERLTADSTSLVLRARIAIIDRWLGSPAPAPAGGHVHASPADSSRVVLHPAVVEIIPQALHLERDQIAAFRDSTAAPGACRRVGRAVIASGANGGIWVRSVLDTSGSK